MCVSVLLFSLGDSHSLQVKGLGPEDLGGQRCVVHHSINLLWLGRKALACYYLLIANRRAIVGTGTPWQAQQLKFPVWVFHMAEGRGQGLMLC